MSPDASVLFCAFFERQSMQHHPAPHRGDENLGSNLCDCEVGDGRRWAESSNAPANAEQGSSAMRISLTAP